MSTARQLGWFSLNMHLHMVGLDEVYTRDGEKPGFHEVSAPSGADLQCLLALES